MVKMARISNKMPMRMKCGSSALNIGCSFPGRTTSTSSQIVCCEVSNAVERVPPKSNCARGGGTTVEQREFSQKNFHRVAFRLRLRAGPAALDCVHGGI